MIMYSVFTEITIFFFNRWPQLINMSVRMSRSSLHCSLLPLFAYNINFSVNEYCAIFPYATDGMTGFFITLSIIAID